MYSEYGMFTLDKKNDFSGMIGRKELADKIPVDNIRSTRDFRAEVFLYSHFRTFSRILSGKTIHSVQSKIALKSKLFQ